MIDTLKYLNDSIRYIEDNLCEDLELKKIANAACLSEDVFKRVFSNLTGIGVHEYIRRRRLSKAVYEIQNSKNSIIHIAVKYGYSSADAFSRAFEKQHGVKPSFVRKSGMFLNIYLPLSFQITLKGAKGMRCKIVELPEKIVFGFRERFEGNASDRWEQEHYMWTDHHRNIPDIVTAALPDKWFGIWDNGTYMIVSENNSNNLNEYKIKSAKYAVFESGSGGFAGDEFPKLREQVFSEWLPNSEYKITDDYEVEVYHLFPKNEKHKRHYELWIPVT